MNNGYQHGYEHGYKHGYEHATLHKNGQHEDIGTHIQQNCAMCWSSLPFHTASTEKPGGSMNLSLVIGAGINIGVNS